MDNAFEQTKLALPGNRGVFTHPSLRKSDTACGGGGGGPPSTKLRGKTVKSCTEMPAAFGYSGSSGNYIKNTCLTAPVASPQSNLNLYKQYDELTAENKALITQAEAIFKKIKKLNSLNDELDAVVPYTALSSQSTTITINDVFLTVVPRAHANVDNYTFETFKQELEEQWLVKLNRIDVADILRRGMKKEAENQALSGIEAEEESSFFQGLITTVVENLVVNIKYFRCQSLLLQF